MTDSKIEQKYITKDEFIELLSFDYKAVLLYSNDTINELKIIEALRNTKRLEEILTATIQMAIVGFGGKSYLKYVYKGETKDLKQLFNDTKIKYNNNLSEILTPETVTPRRLLRVFRFQIFKYLQANTNIGSYLYLKYSENDNKFRSICFPGAEHLVEKREEAEFLLKTYIKLDDSLKKLGKTSGIADRIRRVLMARRLA